MFEIEDPRPSDNLKEILGFDPESGDRVEDKTELQLLKSEQVQTSKAIQNEFKKWFVESKNKPWVLKAVPEHLLAVRSDSYYDVVREYFLYEGQFNNEILPFTQQARLGLRKETDVYYPMDVARFGEPFEAGYEELRSWYNAYSVHKRIRGESLIIYYDNSKFPILVIAELHLTSEEKGNEYKLQLGSLEGEDLEATQHFNNLINRGEITIGSNKNVFRLTFADNKRNLMVKRLEDGNLKDKIVVPVEILRTEILEKLFNPQTLKDPVNAPPELDNSWRFVNLMEAVGVKWERY